MSQNTLAPVAQEDSQYYSNPSQPQSYRIRVFYCYSIPGLADHNGFVKVGDTTTDIPIGLIDSGEKQEILDKAARHRISKQVGTAGIEVTLHWALSPNHFESRDYQIHAQLEQRLVRRVKFSHADASAREWFETTPEIAREAAMDVINGQPGVTGQELRNIVLREEQERFVTNTLIAWRAGESERLWDAKMRFGKTLTAFEFVGRAQKEVSLLGNKAPNRMSKIFVLTHRPVVNDQWAREFTNFLSKKFESQGWQYASKDSAHKSFSQLDLDKPFVYFASMQDMRGKNKKESDDETLDQGFKDSNKEIFEEYWDSVIIDEAHEGTLTKLAEEVRDALKRKFTLYLSGTPYNYIISNRFLSGQIDSWDYVQEQKAKEEWDTKYPGKPNAYSGLPKMWINALDLKDTVNKQYGNKDDISFDFDKMFECDKTTKIFKNQQDINTFLETITSPEVIPMPTLGGSLEMPYSGVGDSLRTRHALWVLPSVDACRAMLKVLEAHPYFKDFKVSNVAGNDLDESKGALEKVKKAIGDNPNKTKTITLTVGRLTTGVTVEAWSTVLMLRNLTSAASYMQTIFRVQSPHEYMGSIKTECFVYDFAPDRALTVLAEVTGVAAKAGGFTSLEAQTALGELLNYMPVISSIGAKDLRKFDASELTQALKRIYKEKVLNSGFDSELLFVKNLENLPSDIREVLNDVRIANGKNGPTTSNKVKDENIIVSNNGLDKKTYEELTEELDELEARPTRELSPEEVLAKEARKSELKDRENMRNILRTISVRIPIMVIALIGKDDKLAKQLKSNFKVSDFIEAFDDESWKEFFQGVTKEMVRKLEPAFDTDILQISVRGWIEEVEDAFEERKSRNYDLYIDKVKNLMARVKNPNKETVFTPYSVVELIYKAAGFTKEQDENTSVSSPWKTIYPAPPSPANFGAVIKKTPTFYDINVKSGLFPLYAAVNLAKANPSWSWQQICDQSIYANARTAAGKWITCALLGVPYDWANITVIDVIKELEEEDISKLKPEEKYLFISHFLTAPLRLKLVGRLDSSVIVKGNLQLSDIRDMDKRESVKKRVKDGGVASPDTLFDFVISNPPYQLPSDQGGHTVQIYDKFYLMGREIAENLCMIFLLGWQKTAGKAAGSVQHHKIRGDKQIISIDNYYEGPDSPIKLFNASTGGVNIILWKKNHNNNGQVSFFEYGKLAGKKDLLITQEINKNTQEIFETLDSYRIIYGNLKDKVPGRNPFGVPSFILKTHRSENSYVKSIPGLNDIKCLYNHNKNTPFFVYISPDAPFLKKNNITKWKTVFPRTGAYRVWRDNYILEPGVVFRESYLCLYSDSKIEAINWQTFLRTNFCRFMLMETANDHNILSTVYRFIPDISKTINPRTKKVGMLSDWTDADLVTLFNLTAEQVKYIQETVHSSKATENDTLEDEEE